MSAPLRIRLNPHEMTDRKVKRMFRYETEELLEHPMAFYRAGFDPLAATGRVQPMMDFVLLRAITGVEINRKKGGFILSAGDGDQLGDAQCFEIVAVGPVIRRLQAGSWWRRIKEALGFAPGGISLLGRVGAGVNMVRIHYMHGSVDDLIPGNHCVSVASAADALDPEGDGIFQLVRACFIPAAWDPEGAAADVVVSLKDAHQVFLSEEATVVESAKQLQAAHVENVVEARREEEKFRMWINGMPYEGEERPKGWKLPEGFRFSGRSFKDEAASDGPQAPTVIIPARHQSARQ